MCVLECRNMIIRQLLRVLVQKLLLYHMTTIHMIPATELMFRAALSHRMKLWRK